MSSKGKCKSCQKIQQGFVHSILRCTDCEQEHDTGMSMEVSRSYHSVGISSENAVTLVEKQCTVYTDVVFSSFSTSVSHSKLYSQKYMAGLNRTCRNTMSLDGLRRPVNNNTDLETGNNDNIPKPLLENEGTLSQAQVAVVKSELSK